MSAWLGCSTRDIALSHDPLWWSHEGNRAIRVGNFKLVSAAGENWELFNLREDRAETNNLAEEFPAKVSELAEIWTRKRDEFYQLAASGRTDEP